MSNSPRVSVVMTAYNSASFVRETIESILGQTFEDFEYIIVDDCSSDETPDIIRSYDDPRIRHIRNATNQGISGSRNIGLDAARGEFLAPTDHDDLSLPQRLAREVAFLDAHPEVVLVAGTARTLENGRVSKAPPAVTEPHLIRWQLMLSSPITHSAVCVRLNAIRDHRLYYRPEYHYAEDYDLYHRLARIGDLACIDEPVVVYRYHGDNASHRYQAEMDAHGKAFLVDVYRELLGDDTTEADIDRVWRLVNYGHRARDIAELEALGAFLARTLAAYLEKVPLTPGQAEDIRRAASRSWWVAVAKAARFVDPAALSLYHRFPELARAPRPPGDVLECWLAAAIGPRALARIRPAVRRLAGRGVS